MKYLVLGTILFFMPCALYGWWGLTDPRSLYQQGKFDLLAQHYQKLQIDDPYNGTNNFNLATALYKQHKFKQAHTNFSQVFHDGSASEHLKEKAYFNWGTSRYYQAVKLLPTDWQKKNVDKQVLDDAQTIVRSAIEKFDNALVMQNRLSESDRTPDSEKRKKRIENNKEKAEELLAQLQAKKQQQESGNRQQDSENKKKSQDKDNEKKDNDSQESKQRANDQQNKNQSDASQSNSEKKDDEHQDNKDASQSERKDTQENNDGHDNGSQEKSTQENGAQSTSDDADKTSDSSQKTDQNDDQRDAEENKTNQGAKPEPSDPATRQVNDSVKNKDAHSQAAQSLDDEKKADHNHSASKDYQKDDADQDDTVKVPNAYQQESMEDRAQRALLDRLQALEGDLQREVLWQKSKRAAPITGRGQNPW